MEACWMSSCRWSFWWPITFKKRSMLIFINGLLTSCYRNRSIANCLHCFEAKFAMKIQWNFFAASQCKETVNGIGGTIKRVAAYLVTSRERKIPDALSFYKAIKLLSKICFVYSKHRDGKKVISFGFDHLINNAIVLTGKSFAHSLETFEQSSVVMHSRTGTSYTVKIWKALWILM